MSACDNPHTDTSVSDAGTESGEGVAPVTAGVRRSQVLVGRCTVGVVRTVGNIIWLLLAGIWMSLAYLVAGVLAIVGIVTIPLALPAFKLSGYALWPFGRMVVPRPDRDVALNAIGNIVWLILCGWWLAIGHLVTAVLLAITIIGIPFAVASLKLAGLALWPYGRTVVPIPDDGTLPPDAIAVRTG